MREWESEGEVDRARLVGREREREREGGREKEAGEREGE